MLGRELRIAFHDRVDYLRPMAVEVPLIEDAVAPFGAHVTEQPTDPHNRRDVNVQPKP